MTYSSFFCQSETGYAIVRASDEQEAIEKFLINEDFDSLLTDPEPTDWDLDSICNLGE